MDLTAGLSAKTHIKSTQNSVEQPQIQAFYMVLPIQVDLNITKDV